MLSTLRKFFKRFVAASVIITFLFTGLFVPLPSLFASDPETSLARTLSYLEIPPELGTVEEIYVPSTRRQAPGEDVEHGARRMAPFVIHIQDAHAHPEAQQSIQGILEYLAREKKIEKVAVEGAFGRIDRRLFNFFSLPEVNEAVADYLVQIGELSGAELFALRQKGSAVEIYGVENPRLYRESFRLFQRVKTPKARIEKLLHLYQRKLEELEARFLNGELKNFVQKRREWEEKQDQSLEYFKTLKGLSQKYLGLDLADPRHQFEWPNLARVIKVGEMEPSLKQELSRSELERLKKELGEKLPEGRSRQLLLSGLDSFLKDPHAFSRNFPEVKSLRHFFETLYQETDRWKISLLDYPHLLMWGGLLILREEIDASTLFKEIALLEERLEERLVRGDLEKNLLTLGKDFSLVRKLSGLGLRREDYETYRDRKSHLKPASLLVRFKSLSRKKERYPLLSETLMERAEAFYRLSRRRDRVLLENTLKLEVKDSSRATVLITGGFHSEGLRELLRKWDLPYAVLRPRMTQLEETGLYEKVMMGEHARLDYFFARPNALGVPFLIQPGMVYRAAQTLPERQRIVLLGALLTTGVRRLRERGWSGKKIYGELSKALAKHPDIFGDAQLLWREEEKGKPPKIVLKIPSLQYHKAFVLDQKTLKEVDLAAFPEVAADPLQRVSPPSTLPFQRDQWIGWITPALSGLALLASKATVQWEQKRKKSRAEVRIAGNQNQNNKEREWDEIIDRYREEANRVISSLTGPSEDLSTWMQNLHEVEKRLTQLLPPKAAAGREVIMTLSGPPGSGKTAILPRIVRIFSISSSLKEAGLKEIRTISGDNFLLETADENYPIEPGKTIGQKVAELRQEYQERREAYEKTLSREGMVAEAEQSRRFFSLSEVIRNFEEFNQKLRKLGFRPYDLETGKPSEDFLKQFDVERIKRLNDYLLKIRKGEKPDSSLDAYLPIFDLRSLGRLKFRLSSQRIVQILFSEKDDLVAEVVRSGEKHRSGWKLVYKRKGKELNQEEIKQWTDDFENNIQPPSKSIFRKVIVQRRKKRKAEVHQTGFIVKVRGAAHKILVSHPEEGEAYFDIFYERGRNRKGKPLFSEKPDQRVKEGETADVLVPYRGEAGQLVILDWALALNFDPSLIDVGIHLEAGPWIRLLRQAERYMGHRGRLSLEEFMRHRREGWLDEDSIVNVSLSNFLAEKLGISPQHALVSQIGITTPTERRNSEKQLREIQRKGGIFIGNTERREERLLMLYVHSRMNNPDIAQILKNEFYWEPLDFDFKGDPKDFSPAHLMQERLDEIAKEVVKEEIQKSQDLLTQPVQTLDGIITAEAGDFRFKFREKPDPKGIWGLNAEDINHLNRLKERGGVDADPFTILDFEGKEVALKMKEGKEERIKLGKVLVQTRGLGTLKERLEVLASRLRIAQLRGSGAEGERILKEAEDLLRAAIQNDLNLAARGFVNMHPERNLAQKQISPDRRPLQASLFVLQSGLDAPRSYKPLDYQKVFSREESSYRIPPEFERIYYEEVLGGVPEHEEFQNIFDSAEKAGEPKAQVPHVMTWEIARRQSLYIGTLVLKSKIRQMRTLLGAGASGAGAIQNWDDLIRWTYLFREGIVYPVTLAEEVMDYIYEDIQGGPERMLQIDGGRKMTLEQYKKIVFDHFPDLKQPFSFDRIVLEHFFDSIAPSFETSAPDRAEVRVEEQREPDQTLLETSPLQARRAEVRVPTHPFLIEVHKQAKIAQEAIEKRNGIPKGSLDGPFKAFLAPANVYKKWITTRKPLSNGEQPTFFIARVWDHPRNPFDGKPQRSQGGLRMVDSSMIVPAFYDQIPPGADPEIRKAAVETWFTELATALMTDMTLKNIKLAMSADRRVRGGKGVFALVQWKGDKLTSIQAPTPEDKAILMRDIALAFAQDNIIHELTNAGAPDVNPWKDRVSTSQLMAWMIDETIKYLTAQPAHDLWTQRAPGLLDMLKGISEEAPVIETPYLDKTIEYVRRTGRPVRELSRYTGKPSDKGGVSYREVATGRGAAMGAKHLFGILIKEGKTEGSEKRPLEGKKVAILGAGNAALHAALYVIKEGALVIAINDSGGAIHKREGLSREDILDKIKLIKEGKAKEKTLTYAAKPEAGPYYIEGAELLGKEDEGTQHLLASEVDLIITAGVENQVNESNAEQLKALVVVDAANGGTTPGASKILHKKGKYVLHSITDSVGGVAISIQGEAKANWGAPKQTDEELEGWLDTLIQETVQEDWLAFKEYQEAGVDIDLPTAAHIWRFQELIPSLKRLTPPLLETEGTSPAGTGRVVIDSFAHTQKDSTTVKAIRESYERANYEVQHVTVNGLYADDTKVVKQGDDVAVTYKKRSEVRIASETPEHLKKIPDYLLTFLKDKLDIPLETLRENTAWRALLPFLKKMAEGQWGGEVAEKHQKLIFSKLFSPDELALELLKTDIFQVARQSDGTPDRHRNIASLEMLDLLLERIEVEPEHSKLVLEYVNAHLEADRDWVIILSVIPILEELGKEGFPLLLEYASPHFWGQIRNTAIVALRSSGREARLWLAQKILSTQDPQSRGLLSETLERVATDHLGKGLLEVEVLALFIGSSREEELKRLLEDYRPRFYEFMRSTLFIPQDQRDREEVLNDRLKDLNYLKNQLGEEIFSNLLRDWGLDSVSRWASKSHPVERRLDVLRLFGTVQKKDLTQFPLEEALEVARQTGDRELISSLFLLALDIPFSGEAGRQTLIFNKMAQAALPDLKEAAPLLIYLITNFSRYGFAVPEEDETALAAFMDLENNVRDPGSVYLLKQLGSLIFPGASGEVLVSSNDPIRNRTRVGEYGFGTAGVLRDEIHNYLGIHVLGLLERLLEYYRQYDATDEKGPSDGVKRILYTDDYQPDVYKNRVAIAKPHRSKFPETVKNRLISLEDQKGSKFVKALYEQLKKGKAESFNFYETLRELSDEEIQEAMDKVNQELGTSYKLLEGTRGAIVDYLWAYRELTGRFTEGNINQLIGRFMSLVPPQILYAVPEEESHLARDVQEGNYEEALSPLVQWKLLIRDAMPIPNSPYDRSEVINSMLAELRSDFGNEGGGGRLRDPKLRLFQADYYLSRVADFLIQELNAGKYAQITEENYNDAFKYIKALARLGFAEGNYTLEEVDHAEVLAGDEVPESVRGDTIALMLKEGKRVDLFLKHQVTPAIQSIVRAGKDEIDEEKINEEVQTILDQIRYRKPAYRGMMSLLEKLHQFRNSSVPQEALPEDKLSPPPPSLSYVVLGPNSSREELERALKMGRYRLGAKGMGLIRALLAKIPVPPFVIFSNELSLQQIEGLLPNVMKELDQAVKSYENEILGSSYAQGERPYYLSVRASTYLTIPGQTDTVTNVGMNLTNIRNFISRLQKDGLDQEEAAWTAWDSFRRLLEDYGIIVLGMNKEKFNEIIEVFKKEKQITHKEKLTADQMRDLAYQYWALINREKGPLAFSEDPQIQLRSVVDTVQGSFDKARPYLKRQHVQGEWPGISVIIQAMVYGNIQRDSGAAIVYTRDPNTWEHRMTGNFYEAAQGSDLAQGVVSPLPYQLVPPQNWQEKIREWGEKLETMFGGNVEMEVSIQLIRGEQKPWLLQVREPVLPEPALRFAREPSRGEFLFRATPSSGGAFRGIVVYPGQRISSRQKLIKKGADGVVLIRDYLVPQDVFELLKPYTEKNISVAVITRRGGYSSHTTDIAREQGVTAIVGANQLEWEAWAEEGKKGVWKIGDKKLFPGTRLSIDGMTGIVSLGFLPLASESPSPRRSEVRMAEGESRREEGRWKELRKFRDLSPRPLKGKVVLIRVDFNTPIEKEEAGYRVLNNKRIRASFATWVGALMKGSTPLLMSHLEPAEYGVIPLDAVAEELQRLIDEIVQGGISWEEAERLYGRYGFTEQHYNWLRKQKELKVNYMKESINGNGVNREKVTILPGTVNLLQNTRFGPDSNNAAYYSRQLASLAPIFVNDAPSVSHRKHSSVYGIVEYVSGGVFIGDAMDKEMQELSQLNPDLVFSGGAKVSDKSQLLKGILQNLPSGGRMTTVGAMAYTFMASRGMKIGASFAEKDQADIVKEIVTLANQKGITIGDLLPLDHLVIRRKDSTKPITTITADDILDIKFTDGLEVEEGWEGVEIGPQTIQRNLQWAMEAKQTFWNGPSGVFEIHDALRAAWDKKYSATGGRDEKGREFQMGSEEIAKGLARATQEAKRETYVGGGETATVAEKYGVDDQVTWVFLGGGAGLEYLEGKPWPGAEAQVFYGSGEFKRQRAEKEKKLKQPYMQQVPKDPVYIGINGPGATGLEFFRALFFTSYEDRHFDKIYGKQRERIKRRADRLIPRVINGVGELGNNPEQLTPDELLAAAQAAAKRIQEANDSVHGQFRSLGKPVFVEGGVEAVEEGGKTEYRPYITVTYAVNETAPVRHRLKEIREAERKGEKTGYATTDKIYLLNHRGKDLRAIPWGKYGVVGVFDASESGKTDQDLVGHLDTETAKRFYPHLVEAGKARTADHPPGARIVEYGTGSNIPMVMMGINHEQLEEEPAPVTSNASCTTNCEAPIVKAVLKRHGIIRALLTTIHAYTGDQATQDSKHEDLARATSALENALQSKTGAAENTTEIKGFEELKGKFSGTAIRVPTRDVSDTSLTLIVPGHVTVEEANRWIEEAAETYLRGIVDYRDEHLVATQIINNTASAVFQPNQTKVLHLPNGTTMLKYGVIWYDNETGFSTRAVDHLMEKLRVLEDIEEGRRVLSPDWRPAPAKEKKKKKKGAQATGSPLELPSPGAELKLPKPDPSVPRRKVAINGGMNDATRTLIRQILFDSRDADIVSITGVPGIESKGFEAAKEFAKFLNRDSVSARYRHVSKPGEIMVDAVEGGWDEEKKQYVPGGKGIYFISIELTDKKGNTKTHYLRLEKMGTDPKTYGKLWAERKIDTVYETHPVRDRAQLEAHLTSGAKRVIYINKPDHGPVPVKHAQFGVNHEALHPAEDRILASPHGTAGALALVSSYLTRDKKEGGLGALGIMFDAAQELDERSQHTDSRTGKAAAENIIPMETSHVFQVKNMLPHVLIEGTTVQVPIRATAVSVDIAMPADTKMTAAELNTYLKKAAQTIWKGVVEIIDPEDPFDQKLVSTDFEDKTASAHIRPDETLVVDDGKLAKIILWFDGQEATVRNALDIDDYLYYYYKEKEREKDTYTKVSQELQWQGIDPKHLKPSFAENLRRYGGEITSVRYAALRGGHIAQPPLATVRSRIAIETILAQAMGAAGYAGLGQEKQKEETASLKKEGDAAAVSLGMRSLEKSASHYGVRIIVIGNEGATRDKSAAFPILEIFNSEGKEGTLLFLNDSVEGTNYLINGLPGAWSIITLLDVKNPYSTDGYRSTISYRAKQRASIDPVIRGENTVRKVFEEIASADGQNLEEWVRTKHIVFLGGRERHQPIIDQLDALKASGMTEISYETIPDGDFVPRTLHAASGIPMKVKVKRGAEEKEEEREVVAIAIGGANEHLMSMVAAYLSRTPDRSGRRAFASSRYVTHTMKKAEEADNFSDLELLEFLILNKRIERESLPVKRVGPGTAVELNILEKVRTLLEEVESAKKRPDIKEINPSALSDRQITSEILAKIRRDLDQVKEDLIGRIETEESFVGKAVVGGAAITGARAVDLERYQKALIPVSFTSTQGKEGEIVLQAFLIDEEGNPFLFEFVYSTEDLLLTRFKLMTDRPEALRYKEDLLFPRLNPLSETVNQTQGFTPTKEREQIRTILGNPTVEIDGVRQPLVTTAQRAEVRLPASGGEEKPKASTAEKEFQIAGNFHLSPQTIVQQLTLPLLKRGISLRIEKATSSSSEGGIRTGDTVRVKVESRDVHYRQEILAEIADLVRRILMNPIYFKDAHQMTEKDFETREGYLTSVRRNVQDILGKMDQSSSRAEVRGAEESLRPFDNEVRKGFRALNHSLKAEGRTYPSARWVAINGTRKIFEPLRSELRKQGVAKFLNWDFALEPHLFAGTDGASLLPLQAFRSSSAAVHFVLLTETPNFEAHGWVIAENLHQMPRLFIREFLIDGTLEEAGRLNRAFASEFPDLKDRFKIQAVRRSELRSALQQGIEETFERVRRLEGKGAAARLQDFYDRITLSSPDLPLLTETLTPVKWLIHNDVDSHPGIQSFLLNNQSKLALGELDPERIHRLKEIQSRERVISASRALLEGTDLVGIRELWEANLRDRRFYQSA